MLFLQGLIIYDATAQFDFPFKLMYFKIKNIIGVNCITIFSGADTNTKRKK